MEPFDRSRGRSFPELTQGRGGLGLQPGPKGFQLRPPAFYAALDQAAGALLLGMAVFAPWAFGTTQRWSIGVMNAAGLTLGALLLAKGVLRWKYVYIPARWDDPPPISFERILVRKRDGLTTVLAVLTALLLGYILVSALNARARFIPTQRRFEYFPCLAWLPHSYDSTSTWAAFWMNASLACTFWAARDWLLGKGNPARPRKPQPSETKPAKPISVLRRSRIAGLETVLPTRGDPNVLLTAPVGPARLEMPPRLRLLLWVLCLNGAVLALESILQRLSGTNKLLGLIVPVFNNSPDLQFGPFAYRANAAAFFNLLWPVSLGFWLTLRQAMQARARLGVRIGTGNYLVLLPGAVFMAACPAISTTRGGAIISALEILFVLGIVLWSLRKESLAFRAGICSMFAVIVLLSGILGFNQLEERFKTLLTDQMSHRAEIYQNAVPMAREFPVFGTGAGTFGALYQLYRRDLNQVWHAYLHDDWLEARITLGWVGFGLLLLALGIVLARWFGSGGIRVPWELTATVWVAISGCLLHAVFDFPLQIYSIRFVFVLYAVLLFCVSRKPWAAAG